MFRYHKLAIFFICLANLAFAQEPRFDNGTNVITSRIKNDIEILASDSFMGREAGTYGEILARNFIIGEFKKSGLLPFFGDTSYIQSIPINENLDYGDKNYFGIDGTWFSFRKDFLPVVYSANDSVFADLYYVNFGITAPDLNYDDYTLKNVPADRIFIIEISVPDGMQKQSPFLKYASLAYKIENAIKHGAKGVIFVNSDRKYLYEPINLKSGFKQYQIPVIYFRSDPQYLIKNYSTSGKAYIRTLINRSNSGSAFNVAGYVNNNSDKTVIIGAHYDHLGNGENGSLYKGPEKIHYGADDNASGTAAVIELGRYLKNSDSLKMNYILVAFSAEEIGLYGSKKFADDPQLDPGKISYMINLDMIGRLNPETKKVEVWAAGSSKNWPSIIRMTDNRGLNFKLIKGSVGNSDHYAFYKRHIPTLFFITGVHSDYHKPFDVASKINFNGETEIILYLEQMINTIESKEKPKFRKVGLFSNIGAIFYTMDEMLSYFKE